MIILTLLLSIAALPAPATPLQESQSVEELVRLLTKPRGVCTTTNFTFRTEKRAALALVAMGNASRAHLERAIDELDAGGSSNPCGVEWLLYTYARVRGAAAYPRLMKMLENPRLSHLNREIEIAMAGSLDLTSVITSRDKPGELYGQTQQLGGLPSAVIPQQALDRLVLGLLTGDRKLIVDVLTSSARESFDKFTKMHTWEGVRRRFLPSQQDSLLVVAYRLFLSTGPAEPLRPDFHFDPEPPPSRLTGTVEFYRDGIICGKHSLNFEDIHPRGQQTTFPEWKYAISNSDIEALLANVGACTKS